MEFDIFSQFHCNLNFTEYFCFHEKFIFKQFFIEKIYRGFTNNIKICISDSLKIAHKAFSKLNESFYNDEMNYLSSYNLMLFVLIPPAVKKPLSSEKLELSPTIFTKIILLRACRRLEQVESIPSCGAPLPAALS